MNEQPTKLEQAKQSLIDETGAALWENWLPKLDAVVEAAKREAMSPGYKCEVCGHEHFSEPEP